MRKTLLTLLLLTAGAAGAAGTPAGTTISNVALLDLNDGTTSVTGITSNTVNINVQQVYSLSITPDGTTDAPGQTTTALPGQTATLTYTVTNTGNGTDSINLAALAANATAQGSNIVGIYLDSTTGTVGSYDAGDTLVTSLANVPADGSRTVFVRYTVPTGTTGGAAAAAAHQLNLSGTSVGDTTKTDTNNVGQITVGRVVDLSLTSTQTKAVAAGASVTFTDRLTNTGNTPLTAAEITATVTPTTTNGAAIPNTFGVTYTVVGPKGSVTNTDLETAINAAIGTAATDTLAAGANLDITVTVTPDATAGLNSGAKDGDTLALRLEAYAPLVSSGATILNNAAQGDPQGIITNTTTVQRGVGSASKKVALCTTSTTCPAIGAAGTAAISAKPGDYVVYYLTASNTGTGKLYNIRLKDALPSNFVPTTLGAATSMTGGTIKYSVNGTTWTSDVTTLGTITGGSSTVYVAYENGGSATVIDQNDTFDGGKTLQVKIVGYLRNTGSSASGAVGNTVTFDSAGLNP
ncbi:DUF11 domain-containing protein [Deinococcus sedimenti]|uniref:DUF11 domain-containing protein n=1 Tax=Deinococcus sedimenti TaxID=1867090 RepID=A0ABQ2SBJ4_9DEIO|nr:DUF11 domain-containing protein [Deinococcus sedimenti]GGS10012.1 hypothetical protein GCM10008960_40250 [Deinococcus sedimenti]